ncbi:hypothetical protein DV736_g5904, partial [Chaetothyriales sp. CBS 134916]
MVDNHRNISRLFFEESARPSRFMRSILASPPSARRPQTINTNNPINKAEAHPSAYISIDAKETVAPGKIGVRMADLADTHSPSLASAKSGRPNTHRSRAVIAAQRCEANVAKAAANAARITKKSFKAVRVSPAPLPHDSLSSEEDEKAIRRPSQRTAAVEGEKKRKHATTKVREERNSEEETKVEAGEVAAQVDSRDCARPPKKKVAKATKHTDPVSASPVAEANTSTASRVQAQVSQSDYPRLSTSKVLKKRDNGIKVPRPLDEACAADRMLRESHHAGKPWTEITVKWTELTGKTPGKSSLSVRFMKLQANFADAGRADDLIILCYKAEAEAGLENVVWQKVAAKIKANHNVEMPIPQLRKRFNALKHSGFNVGATLEITANENDDREGVNKS